MNTRFSPRSSVILCASLLQSFVLGAWAQQPSPKPSEDKLGGRPREHESSENRAGRPRIGADEYRSYFLPPSSSASEKRQSARVPASRPTATPPTREYQLEHRPSQRETPNATPSEPARRTEVEDASKSSATPKSNSSPDDKQLSPSAKSTTILPAPSKVDRSDSATSSVEKNKPPHASDSPTPQPSSSPK